MADNASRYGLRWVGSLSGKSEPKPFPVRVANAYQGAINGGSNVDINIGDPIKQLSTGYCAIAQGSEIAGGNAEPLFGVCVGVLPYYDGTRMVFGNKLPGATTYGTILERQSWILVVPVVGNIFEVDADDNVTATTEAAYIALVGENCDHVLTTGSEPKANPRLDISTHGTATSQWRIMEISRTAENQDFSGNYVKLIVTANESSVPPYSTNGVGVGT